MFVWKCSSYLVNYVQAWIIATISSNILNRVADALVNKIFLFNEFIKYLLVMSLVSVIIFSTCFIITYTLFKNLDFKKVLPWIWGLGGLGTLVQAAFTYEQIRVFYELSVPSIFISNILSFIVTVLIIYYWFKQDKRLEGANIFGQVINPYGPEKIMNKNEEIIKEDLEKSKKTPEKPEADNYFNFIEKTEMEKSQNLEKINFVFLDYKKDSLTEILNELDLGNDLEDIKNGKYVLINKHFKIEKKTSFNDKHYFQVFGIENTIPRFWRHGTALKEYFSPEFTFESLNKALNELIEFEIKYKKMESIMETEKVFLLHRDTELEIYSKDYIKTKKREEAKRLKAEKLEKEKNKIKKQAEEDEHELRQKLISVKKLYDDGLITEEVLKKKQEELMNLK